MASAKQKKAATENIKKAQKTAVGKKTMASLAKATKAAPGKRGAAVAGRKRTGSSAPKTRAELYEIARQRDLPGRSKMGRDELARRLGTS